MPAVPAAEFHTGVNTAAGPRVSMGELQASKRDGVTCAILADRNAPLADRLRQLVSPDSGRVFAASLLDGARRLTPALLIVDLGFAEDGVLELLQQLKTEVPQARIIVLSLYDGPTVAADALSRGASAVVLKRTVGEDLLPALEAALAGGTYVSPCFRPGSQATPDSQTH